MLLWVARLIPRMAGAQNRQPRNDPMSEAAQMGILLSDIADADGDTGTIMRLIDAFAASRVAEEHERGKALLVEAARIAAQCGAGQTGAWIASRIRALADQPSKETTTGERPHNDERSSQSGRSRNSQ